MVDTYSFPGTMRNPLQSQYPELNQFLSQMPEGSAQQLKEFLGTKVSDNPPVFSLNAANAAALQEAIRTPATRDQLIAQAGNPDSLRTALAAIVPPAPAPATQPAAPTQPTQPVAAAPATQPGAPTQPAATTPAPSALESLTDLVGSSLGVQDLSSRVSTLSSHVSLMQIPGYSEFSSKLMADTPQATSIRNSLTQIMGGGAEGPAGQAAALERLGQMAQQDPEVFTRLNRLMDANGMQGFLQTVSQTPELQRMFDTGNSDNPASTAQTIQALDEAVAADPDFLQKAGDLIRRHPQLVASASESLTDDPRAGIAQMQQMIQMNSMKDSFLGMVNQFSPELGQMLSGLMDQLVGMMGPRLMGMLGGAGTAPSQIVASAGQQTLHGVGGGDLVQSLVQGLLPGQTTRPEVQPDGTTSYSLADARPGTQPLPQQQPGLDQRQNFSPTFQA